MKPLATLTESGFLSGSEGSRDMKRSLFFALLVAGCLTASARVHAQAAPGQNPPAASTQKPTAKPGAPQDPNAFPKTQPPSLSCRRRARPTCLPAHTTAMTTPRQQAPALAGHGWRPRPQPRRCSSRIRHRGADGAVFKLQPRRPRQLVPSPDDDDQPQGKHHKQAAKPPEHVETSAEDIEVGKYYLQTRNWKAALSRFDPPWCSLSRRPRRLLGPGGEPTQPGPSCRSPRLLPESSRVRPRQQARQRSN